MCGMCLPHCPTYHLTRNEAESPRGRISLIQGMSSGRLPYTAPLAEHLDHCLTCRACEAVCPSGVQYGEIIDSARALLRDKRPAAGWKKRARRFASNVVTHRSRLRHLGQALRLLQRSGVQRAARRIVSRRQHSLSRLMALLPPLPRASPWRNYYPPQGTGRGDVGLFLGCVMELMERATLNRAIQLLTRIGYGVHIPSNQTCCGALHLHDGERDTAARLAATNVAAFNANRLLAVLSVASGCGATLAEYARHHSNFAAPTRDINDFLSTAEWPTSLRFAPLAKKVAVHDPCTMTHVLKQHNAPYHLLARIPNIELVALPDNRRCCGAAGSYMLSQPAMADALRDEKVAALDALRPDIVVTSNIGCALHLRAGIGAAGLNIHVMHAVDLLSQQLTENEHVR